MKQNSETITIKLYDGVLVNYDGEELRLDYICDLWPLFHWDIDNDEAANEAAKEVTRCLFAMGYVDLSFTMKKGHTLTVTIIPTSD